MWKMAVTIYEVCILILGVCSIIMKMKMEQTQGKSGVYECMIAMRRS